MIDSFEFQHLLNWQMIFRRSGFDKSFWSRAHSVCVCSSAHFRLDDMIQRFVLWIDIDFFSAYNKKKLSHSFTWASWITPANTKLVSDYTNLKNSQSSTEQKATAKFWFLSRKSENFCFPNIFFGTKTCIEINQVGVGGKHIPYMWHDRCRACGHCATIYGAQAAEKTTTAPKKQQHRGEKKAYSSNKLQKSKNNKWCSVWQFGSAVACVLVWCQQTKISFIYCGLNSMKHEANARTIRSSFCSPLSLCMG